MIKQYAINTCRTSAENQNNYMGGIVLVHVQNVMSLIKVQSHVVNNFRQKENITNLSSKEWYIYQCWQLLKLYIISDR
jgi:hypothetical protein